MGRHRGYRMEPKFPGILTDDELRAIGVPVLLITGARSAMLTPAEAHARGSLMPHAEVAIVPGSHGGFNRIDELNDRIAAFIEAQTTDKQAAQPAQPPTTKGRTDIFTKPHKRCSWLSLMVRAFQISTRFTRSSSTPDMVSRQWDLLVYLRQP